MSVYLYVVTKWPKLTTHIWMSQIKLHRKESVVTFHFLGWFDSLYRLFLFLDHLRYVHSFCRKYYPVTHEVNDHQSFEKILLKTRRGRVCCEGSIYDLCKYNLCLYDLIISYANQYLCTIFL